MKPSEIPILMYHDISDGTSRWCVAPAEFEEQMSYLHRQGYKTISLTILNDLLKGNKEVNERYIVLTFDDARKGVYENAYPILKRKGYTAAVFVVPEWIGGNAPEQETYSGFMSWEELRELQNNGFEIGSHTFSHKDLTIISEGDIISEVKQAKEAIKAELCIDAEHLSYPYGRFTEDVKRITGQFHRTASTIQHGFVKGHLEYARQWVTNAISTSEFERLLKKPTISVCMIVKNCEEPLRQCLHSVKDIADEIIIVDTGSTDRTKDAAKEFTEKNYDFSWNDDFSEARNESLKHAAGDWILIIDADELIDEEGREVILEAVNNWSITAYAILTRNYCMDSSITGWVPPACSAADPLNNRFGWYPSIKVRLFQNKRGIDFSGAVHEMVEESVKKLNGKIRPLAATIHHYGAIWKSEKDYIRLSLKKTAAGPENAKAYFELGVQYKEKKRYGEAESAFAGSIAIEENSIYPRLNLAIVQQKLYKIDESVKNYYIILEKDEGCADAYFGLGFCSFKKGDLEKAEENFKKAIEIKEHFLDAYLNLGAVQEKQGKYQDALRTLQKAMALSPDSPRVYFNCGVVFEKTGHFDKALHCYRKAEGHGYKKEDELRKRIEFVSAGSHKSYHRG